MDAKQKSDVEVEVSFLAVYEHKAPDVQIEDKDISDTQIRCVAAKESLVSLVIN